MEERGREFLIFFLSSFLSQIYGNLNVGFRQVNNESALRDEGYAWIPKAQDFTENSGKNSKKNPNFWFFSDLRHSNCQHFSDQ